MATRYVKSSVGSSSGAFESPANPARTIADAMRAAKAGDTIEIQDAAVYREEELIINRALTLVSSYIVSHPNANPAAAGFVEKNLPTIIPKGRHRAVKILGTPNTRSSFGPVTVSGINFIGGHSIHTAADPALGCGGAIAVVDADNVQIKRCVFRGNHTQVAPTGAWPESDRLALRNGILDIVGGIFSPATEAAINAVIALANKQRSSQGKPTLSPLSRTMVLAQLASAFDKRLPAGRPNHWLGGQAFGGGVAFVWSNGELSNCLLRGNKAEGRGAAVAVSGYGWPSITHCWIDGNASGDAGRRDGGGVGCSVSFPGKLTRNLSEIDLVRFLTAKLHSARSAVRDPLSHVSISDLIDLVVWLAHPGEAVQTTVQTTRGFKPVLQRIIAKDFESAVWQLIYWALAVALSTSKWAAWKKEEIERAKNSRIVVQGCTISQNVADDDGGGLYASVLSRVDIQKTAFLKNLARSSGGAVRLTMGSSAKFDRCEFSGNTAIVDARHDPKKTMVNGGGGISCRNVDLALTQSDIGLASLTSTAPATPTNVTTDHAGGGLAYQADTEGDLAGIPDLWTAIQWEVFDVKNVTVTIDRGSKISSNGAGFSEKRSALPRTDKAKGGGAWFIQGEFFDAPRLELSISGVQTSIRGNIAQSKGYKSKLSNDVIAKADEVCIQDVIGHKEWTEVNFTPLLDGDTLRFKA